MVKFDFYYAIETQKKIINAVLAGDYALVEELIDRVYVDNFQNRCVSLEAREILLFELIGTVVRVACQTESGISIALSTRLESMRRSESVAEIFSSIKDIFQEICNSMDQAKRSHNLELKQLIIEYIEENLTDSNFSQTIMAEALMLSPSYLSHFFREQFGETMVDYVNSKRIDYAKKIFSEHDGISNSDVAERVGCCSDKALIRIFKKYTGVTPGRYRDMQNSAKDRITLTTTG